MKPVQMFKIILIGESGVGKTSLINRYVENSFDPVYKSTIGCDFLSKNVQYEGVEYVLQIWDTAGHEKFSSMISSFYRGSDGAFVVFDVTDTASFSNLDSWINEFSGSINNDVPIIVCGNKTDLENRCVPTASAQQWCDLRNYTYVESSAKSSAGVTDMFATIVKLIVDNKKGDDVSEDLKPIAINVKPKNDCC
ncbi:ehrab7g protein, putative [Entamoeba invadens IP1]|uniref:Ras-related protein Rab-7b n=1 Tax=Entamoeba invadens IP1 TaxID=370355 RepID=A0A0A1UAP8_ENTIV|nr:ehrab7g protein, putative [Entamoeba invadens IP1]ELP90270.1 ehrab7g protein, putative [Entamoeba invadens IP1]|eukprot:XP_004257041.1 ehrab7g protein, putative [Entamoeba invadens IP1]